MARNRSTRVRPIDNPEIIKMAEYIFKRPENTTEVKNYTEQIDALDYEFNPKPMKDRNLDNKHRYDYNIKIIDSNNSDNSTDDEIRLFMEPQYSDSRKHLISSLKRDKQPEYIFEPKRSKKPGFDVRNYNMLQKPNNRDFKKSRKNFTFELPARKVVTTNHLNLPEFHLKNATKHKNRKKTIENNVLKSRTDSKSRDFLVNITNNNEYLRLAKNRSENPFKDNYTYYPSELSLYVYNQIPRIGTDLTVIKTQFELSSPEYQFVSSF